VNRLAVCLIGSSLLAGAVTASAVELGDNVTLAADYVWRGKSQTDEEATIQGGFDLTSESGFYGGIWASNVGFDGSIEVDYVVGIGNSITESVSYDIHYVHYDYPNQPERQPNSDFEEIDFSLTLAGVTGGVAYSNDFSGETGTATYLYLDLDLSLPNEFGLTFHYGAQDIDAGGRLRRVVDFGEQEPV
jgi:uncharacterized protein (TIGR02001 family)